MPVAVTGLNGAIALAMGSNHSCAIVTGGFVQCWGWNGLGQLGNGSTTIGSLTPVAVTGLSGVTAVSLGVQHSCAIVEGGAVQCWGGNNYGQLGNGVTSELPTATPTAVLGLSGATGLSLGGAHSCAIVTGGAMQCWGANYYGQLGNGSMAQSSTMPVAVMGLTGVIALTSGAGHSCAIIAVGGVRCWGYNEYGQLGNGSTNQSRIPVTVTGLAGGTAMASGRDHNCAIVAGGAVRCWGSNRYEQLGSITNLSVAPVTVMDLTGATSLALGTDHSCAIMAAGAVQCWGKNSLRQLSNGSTSTLSATPVAVVGLAGVTALALGGAHTCALMTGGAVGCWGSNEFGQLGNGNASIFPSGIPVTVTGLNAATALALGYSHSCAIVAGGAVRCWGRNNFGQLGNGGFNDSTTPVAVTGLSGATALALGFSHSCAIVAGGAVQCWGYNDNGQLGSVSVPIWSATPLTVASLIGATALALGGGHSCAIVTGGAVRCWGYNGNGQLGNGSLNDSTTPVAVTGLSGANALALGGGHSCAIVAGGAVQCWGYNSYGQLGNGSIAQNTTPSSVKSITGATAFALGSAHSCAIVDGGATQCWGYNSYGQLGNGVAGYFALPQNVIGSPFVSNFASGFEGQ